jgi:hypothetical protein
MRPLSVPPPQGEVPGTEANVEAEAELASLGLARDGSKAGPDTGRLASAVQSVRASSSPYLRAASSASLTNGKAVNGTGRVDREV